MKNSWCEIIQETIISLSTNKKKVPTQVILLQLAYLALFDPINSPYLLLILAFLLGLILKINYFWFLGIIIQPSLNYLSIVNMLMGLVSCTERWKLHIYIFLILYFYTFSNPIIHNAYNIIAFTGFSIQIYFKLPIPKLEDNKQFFVGFNCLCIHYIYVMLRKRYFNLQRFQYDCFQFILLILVFYISSQVIFNKFKKLTTTQKDNSYDPLLTLHKITMIKKRSKQVLHYSGIQSQHKDNCVIVDCFCRAKSPLSFEQQYIRKLMIDSFRKYKSLEFNESLQEFYIELLLQHNLFTLAVEAFILQNDYKWDIFKEMKQQRLKKMLKERLNEMESGYSWKNKIEDVFTYQNNLVTLKRKIIELLTMKTQFWNQILKTKTKARTLRQKATCFQQHFNQMNKYYIQQIAPIQQQTKVYSGTINYSLFLLVATNYKRLAETYMKTFLNKNQQQKFNKELYNLAILKISLAKNRMGQIVNLNNNCVKMMSANQKGECLHKSINQLIPDCYLRQHCAGMSRLKQFNDKGKVGQEIESIFLLTKTKCIVACSVFLKFSPDIFNELSIVSIFKHFQDGRDYILINGEGVVQYLSRQDLNPQIAQSKQVQAVIKQFCSYWKNVNEQNPKYQYLNPIKFQIKHESQDYTCYVSSPLCESFQYPKKPPLHLRINNDTKTYFNEQIFIDQEDKAAVRRIKQVFRGHSNESQTSSNGSRESLVVDLIKLTKTENNFKIFNYFYLGMVLIFVLIVCIITVQFHLTDIKWLKLDGNSNTLKLLSIHYDIQYQLAHFMNKQLTIYGIKQGIISNSQYSESIGKTNYQQQISIQMDSICKTLSELIQSKDKQIGHISKTYYDILEKEQLITTQRSRPFHMKFNNLLNYGLSNCYNFAKGFDFGGVDLNQIYWQYIFPYYQNIFQNLGNFVITDFANYEALNKQLFALFSILIIVMTVPIVLASKKIKKMQSSFFDIMLSISPSLIEEQIKHLQHLSVGMRYSHSNSLMNQVRQNGISGEEQSNCEGQSFKENQSFRRQRAGELDNSGSDNSMYFLIIIVVSFICFLCVIFVLRYHFYLDSKKQLDLINTQTVWRNQRLDIIVNIKKWLVGLRPDELIQNKSLQNWIHDTIQLRKQNFLFRDSIENVQLNCTISGPLCKNVTSVEMMINVMYGILYSETYVKKTTQYIGVMDVLVQTSKSLNNMQIYDGIMRLTNIGQTTKGTIKYIYLIFFGMIGLGILATVSSIRKTRRQYIYESRFVTLLNQQMIKSSKSVQSYLHNLAREQ